ncbi:MAG TPA: hypothetical protein VNC22_23335 [Sporichthya sp.]|jgi:hypothetical protein|nr:hypothetical protein [Sporichthya sp.]
MFENIDGWAVVIGTVVAGFFGALVNHLVIAFQEWRRRRGFSLAIENRVAILAELERQFT